MDHVRENLNEASNIQDRLLCVSRLRVIALALGEEKTRSELLPFLTQLRETPDEVGDEVLTSIAEVLGGFEEFVGGAAHAHTLLVPLFGLCTIDETTVRSQAVDAINTLGRCLSAEQTFTHIAPKVLELFEQADWFTPRVSACGLVATAYKGCLGASASSTVAVGEKTAKPDEVAGDLVEAFRKQFADSEPMVRRSAALKLGEVSLAFGDAITRDNLVEHFERLIESNEQESIRVNALKSSPALFKVCSLASSNTGARYLECVADKSWRVRVAVSESLSGVANSCKDMGGAEIEKAQVTFLTLLNDTEAEVRHATAAHGAAAASVLGADFAVQELVPALKNLVLDESVANRVDLAGVLVEMAAPLGQRLAAEVYLGAGAGDDDALLPTLLLDQSTNLRLAVIGKLAALIDVVTITEAPQLLKMVFDLAEDKNWRVRHAALILLPQLGTQMSQADFTKAFCVPGGQSAFTARAEDNCALIRQDFVCCCAQLGQQYGAEWVKECIVPCIANLAEQKNYQLRAVILHASCELGELLKGSGVLESQFLPASLKMADDRVPNLKLNAAKSLGVVAIQKLVDASTVKDKIVPVLEKLQADADPDVSTNAKEALAEISK